MANHADITKEYLHTIFDYDGCLGKLIWRFRSDVPKEWNTRFAGKIAGSDNKTGRWKIVINKKQYKAYHLIWVYHHGFWPKCVVDHIDRDSTNDKIENLREADYRQNAGNAKLYSTNTTKLRGVCKFRNKYRSQLRIREVKIWLGDFNCPAAASFAYQIAADRHFGSFARVF